MRQCPNFLPFWELQRRNGKWYHIDDQDLIAEILPINFVEDELPRKGTSQDMGLDFPTATSRYNSDTCVEVPYSMVPPTRGLSDHTYDEDQSFKLAPCGIGQDWLDIHHTLGDIISVPPDGRLILAFEKNELRLRSAKDAGFWRCGVRQGLENYLESMTELLKNMRLGDFIVRDWNSEGSSCNYGPTVYYTDSQLKIQRENNPFASSILAEAPHHFKAAAFARLKEKNGFMVPPTRVPLNSIPPGCDVERAKLNGEFSPIQEPLIRDATSTLNRQWHREIFLCHLADAACNKKVFQTSEDVAQMFFHIENQEERRLSNQRTILVMFERHLSCERVKTSLHGFQLPDEPFHITWHSLQKLSLGSGSCSWWPSGPFYLQQQSLILKKQAFTLAYFDESYSLRRSNRSSGTSEKFRTCVVLAAPLPGADTWSTQPDWHSPKFTDRILHHIRDGIQNATMSWEKIIVHFAVISEQDAPILDPRRHDEMLFEDESFSRSRRYFWALASIKVFVGEIEDTIETWGNFWEARKKTFIDPPQSETDDAGPLPDSLLGDIVSTVQRLRELKAEFLEIHEDIVNLREGVCILLPPRISKPYNMSLTRIAVVQRQQRGREPYVDSAWRERETSDLREHFLPTVGVLHGNVEH